MSTHTDITNSVPVSKVSAFRLIEDSLDQVRELINKQLTVPAKTSDISRLLEYMSASSGKMIRPGLVLLSHRVVRDASCEKKTQYDIRDTQYEVIRVAAIVEMIHNATLLHDDVVDERQRQRRLPAINNLGRNESAVLLGDFLLSHVFKMCTDLEPRVTHIIASAAARTCVGELRQIIQKDNWQLSESEYIDIITEKSAAFFSSCCRLGALLAHATETQLQSLEHFGLNAGIAFQITDGLLELTRDESQTGKTVGSDVDKNKVTLAVIHLLSVVDHREKGNVYSALNHTAGTGKDVLTKMLKSHGSLKYAHSRAQDFVDKALLALTDLRRSCAKDALIETARFMANRAI